MPHLFDFTVINGHDQNVPNKQESGPKTFKKQKIL